MEVIGSLLNFCNSTFIVNIMFQKFLGVFNLLCVTGDILLLTFWLLVTDVYILYLIEYMRIKTFFIN
jgi:hypothetical protein